MKSYIQISLRTKVDTVDWKLGSQLVHSLLLDGGLLAPEFISHNVDKVKEPLEGEGQAKAFWAEKASVRANGSLSDFFLDFAWKRKRNVKSSGNVVHTFRNVRNQVVPGSVRLTAAFSEQVDWSRLFKRWCEIFPPQVGMLHYFTEQELGEHERHNSFQIGSFKAALKPEVSDAGWAMFYGEDFAEKVEPDLLYSEGFPVERMGGGFLVKITEHIDDVRDNFSLFYRRRVQLKKLFPEGFFLTSN